MLELIKLWLGVAIAVIFGAAVIGAAIGVFLRIGFWVAGIGNDL